MSKRTKYVIIATVILSLLIILAAFLISLPQTGILKGVPFFGPIFEPKIVSEISDAPLTSETFEGIVKEVSEKFLLVEILGGSQKTLQIPLDQNVKFKSSKSGETNAQNLTAGQRLTIREIKMGQLVEYDITVYPK